MFLLCPVMEGLSYREDLKSKFVAQKIEEERRRQQKFMENETKRKEREMKKAEFERKKELAREKRKEKRISKK